MHGDCAIETGVFAATPGKNAAGRIVNSSDRLMARCLQKLFTQMRSASAYRGRARGEVVNNGKESNQSISAADESATPARVVERLFAQPAAEGQALRRQWMEDLQLPVATIDDIVNAGGKLPKDPS